jgi:HPt (histidine-containing phosphotransfer) domain-containing protein
MGLKQQCFDIERLNLLKDYKDENNRDLRLSLIDIYLQVTPGEFIELEKSMMSALETHRTRAHTIKSSSAAVGGTHLADLMEKLETQELNPGQRQEIVQLAKLEFETLTKELIQFKSNLE